MGASLLLLVCWLTAGDAQAEEPFATPVVATTAPPVRDAVTAGPGVKIDSSVIPIQMRQPPRGAVTQQDQQGLGYALPSTLPGPERLFRLDSEAGVIQRIKQEARERKAEELPFPDAPILTADRSPPMRAWLPQKMEVEPSYVCHSRLFFEDVNAERYGWEAGPFQPLLSSLLFYKDFALLPMHAFSYPCRCYDCSAGKCLPGDPVPFLLYPPDVTLTGVLAEAGTVAGLMAVFP